MVWCLAAPIRPDSEQTSFLYSQVAAQQTPTPRGIRSNVGGTTNGQLVSEGEGLATLADKCEIVLYGD